MDQKLKERLKDRIKGFCHVCRFCNGIACAGEVPGMGGAGTGSSFQANIEALSKIKLKMRCLHDAIHPETKVDILGLNLDLPLMAAPIGGLSWNICKEMQEREYAEVICEGCKNSGIIAGLPDAPADYVLEDALSAAQKINGYAIPFIKPWKIDEFSHKFEQAVNAGCKIIGMDIDSIGLITLALHGRPVMPKTAQELAAIVKMIHDAGCKFILKGIMSPEDAVIAVDAGCDAIIVSNHGGRILDHVPGTASVLSDVVRSVKGWINVLVDGGIRSGVDILKMLALGADAVLIGRPFIFAAVGGGREGVEEFIQKTKNELISAMTLTGCANIKSIGSQILI